MTDAPPSSADRRVSLDRRLALIRAELASLQRGQADRRRHLEVEAGHLLHRIAQLEEAGS